MKSKGSPVCVVASNNEAWNDKGKYTHSRYQRQLGKRDWENDGLRRYMCAMRATLTCHDNDLHVEFTHDNDVRYREVQQRIKASHIKSALETANVSDGMDLAQRFPALFWNVLHHTNTRDIDKALQTYNIAGRGRKRQRRQTQPLKYTTRHFTNDEESYEVESLESDSSEDDEDDEEEYVE